MKITDVAMATVEISLENAVRLKQIIEDLKGICEEEELQGIHVTNSFLFLCLSVNESNSNVMVTENQLEKAINKELMIDAES